MKAANMRAQLVAQIAGQMCAAWIGRGGAKPEDAVNASVTGAEAVVTEVERRLGKPIYKDRPQYDFNAGSQS